MFSSHPFSHSLLQFLSHSQAFASIFGFPFLPSFVPRKRKLQTKKEGIGNDDCGKEQGTMTVGRNRERAIHRDKREQMEAKREEGGNMRNKTLQGRRLHDTIFSRLTTFTFLQGEKVFLSRKGERNVFSKNREREREKVERLAHDGTSCQPLVQT